MVRLPIYFMIFESVHMQIPITSVTSEELKLEDTLEGLIYSSIVLMSLLPPCGARGIWR
jgi:hypothetical protein